jgi:arsenate reductase
MDWKGFESLQEYVALRLDELDMIPLERRGKLEVLAALILQNRGEEFNLIFICTHNSRRSHMAHLWAALGAEIYGAENVFCFSGGTEATAFNPQAVFAIKAAGFKVKTKIPGANPIYLVSYPGAAKGERVFSKKYTDPPNPSRLFHAVMTCSDADEACPVVTGASSRFAITYEDPKAFDGTPQAKEAYAERSRQISREMLFLFSLTAKQPSGG